MVEGSARCNWHRAISATWYRSVWVAQQKICGRSFESRSFLGLRTLLDRFLQQVDGFLFHEIHEITHLFFELHKLKSEIRQLLPWEQRTLFGSVIVIAVMLCLLDVKLL